MGIYVNILVGLLYRLRLCLSTYYAIQINSRQYFKFLSYFWNTLMLHNSVDYAHTNIYTKMTMVVYNMFYSRCTRSGPPHQIIFTLYSYLSFLTAFITILVGLLVQISIYITAILWLIQYIIYGVCNIIGFLMTFPCTMPFILEVLFLVSTLVDMFTSTWRKRYKLYCFILININW